MNHYIDMHCHIIPGVDDGARTIKEARQMLEIAYSEGIRCIIATPHFHPRRGEVSEETIRERLHLLRMEAKKVDENFRIFLGREIYYRQGVVELLRQGRLQTMNRKDYVLLEFSSIESADTIVRGIQQIQAEGFRVILAHAERYESLVKDIDLVRYLCRTGVLIQLNTSSITGRPGRAVKKFVKILLDEELVFCMGTDAHDLKKRIPQMKKAAQIVEKKYGEDYARRIFFSNALQMLKK